jgi:hypothetical protein
LLDFYTTMYYNITMLNDSFFIVAAKIFRRPSEGVAEGGGWGEEFRHARAFRRAERGGYVRFLFLDLCIKFGKMISKVCEGFNSGAIKLDTNSFLEDESVRSPSPANGVAGLRSATAPPSLWREMKRILMLSGEFNFFFLTINNTNI